MPAEELALSEVEGTYKFVGSLGTASVVHRSFASLRMTKLKLCFAELVAVVHFVHRSTQSFTVWYHSREFCGFSTQWLSSGK